MATLLFQEQIEMTLDCKLSTASAIKGHFCSLLISNIFCYPRFRYLPLAFSHPTYTFLRFL